MVDAYVQLYRSSVLCDILTGVLEDLVEEEKIQEDLKVKVLDCFDRSCLEALQKRAEAKGQLTVRSTRCSARASRLARQRTHCCACPCILIGVRFAPFRCFFSMEQRWKLVAHVCAGRPAPSYVEHADALAW